MTRVLCVVRNAAAAFGLLVLVVTLTPIVRPAGVLLAGRWNEPKGDVLAVLAGSFLGDGTIGESSYWRTIYAGRAWRTGGFQRVILSGQGSAAMKDLLRSLDVPDSSISVENCSTSTRESALALAGMLNTHHNNVVLLTSDYHMYRALAALRKAGLDPVPSPFPDVIKRSYRWNTRWPAFLEVVGESVKIAYYRVRGWI